MESMEKRGGVHGGSCQSFSFLIFVFGLWEKEARTVVLHKIHGDEHGGGALVQGAWRQ